jgi:anti-sigma B factor antagonist
MIEPTEGSAPQPQPKPALSPEFWRGRSPDALEFTIRPAGRDGVVLEVAGEVDMATAPQLADALAVQLARPVSAVVVDLARVTFLGSSGLAVLVTAHRGVQPGKRLLIATPGRAAYRAFALTGLAEQLPLYRSAEDALAEIG